MLHIQEKINISHPFFFSTEKYIILNQMKNSQLKTTRSKAEVDPTKPNADIHYIGYGQFNFLSSWSKQIEQQRRDLVNS